MSKYNFLEKKIAKFLNSFPKIKEKIKRAYQIVSFYLNRKEYTFQIHEAVSIEKKSNTNFDSFWGYYDKSPERKGRYLYHKLPSAKISKRNKDNVEIFCEGKKVSSTSAWNWQQGSMLTWINDSLFIHNVFREGNYGSKIINTKDNSVRHIDFPIYSVNGEGDFAISLNFKRLAKLRPDYGYFNLDSSTIQKVDSRDGVYYIDIINNKKKVIIDFKKLLMFHPRMDMKDSWHKVNHLDLSPSGERFMFHHRWITNDGIKKSRLITANIDGSEMYLLSDDDMVSHCTWKNENQIVGWMTKKGIGDYYFLLEDKSQKYSIVGEGVLKEDGHPSFSTNEEWMLTDAYPDKSRMSTLLLYNLKSKKLTVLGEFYSSLRYTGELRCDLHPRFNTSNNKITFDSVHEGKRAVYEIDVNRIMGI